ncbi:MAG TPA: carbon monoxide dehydrogenase, partial [Anaerolineae bacterium]
PGVAAHQVKKRTTFKVEYGPVRAADLPAYLIDHYATPEMRRVRYTLRDRLALVPVEVILSLPPMLIAAVCIYFIGGWESSVAVVASVLTGAAVFPILLPWLPTHDFSTKGFLLGVLVALPFVLLSLQGSADAAWWYRAGRAIVPLMIWPAVTAFLALNFTGSSTFTSRSGVQREIYTYVPAMVWLCVLGAVLMVGLPIVRALGG